MIRFLSGSQHPRLSVSALPPLLPRQRFVGSNYNKTLHLLKIFFLNWQNESLKGSKLLFKQRFETVSKTPFKKRNREIDLRKHYHKKPNEHLFQEHLMKVSIAKHLKETTIARVPSKIVFLITY